MILNFTFIIIIACTFHSKSEYKIVIIGALPSFPLPSLFHGVKIDPSEIFIRVFRDALYGLINISESGYLFHFIHATQYRVRDTVIDFSSLANLHVNCKA